MKELKIELATVDERDWAAKLMSRSEPWIKLRVTIDQCMKACHDPDHRIYIARLEKKPAGFIILHPMGLAGSPYIKSICVAESLRGSGTGAAMIEFAEKLFRPDSRHIFLCVSSFNRRAQEFYKRLGYNNVGEFKNYIIEGESEILMHKRLR